MQELTSIGGFLGTGAPLLQDINIVVQIVFFIMLCLGIIAQRRGLYKWHDRLQTPAVVLNLLFIGLVMVPSARFVVREIPARLSETYYLIPTVHIILGSLSEGLAIYCMLAGFKILPRKIGVLRYFMWTSFILWTATVIFGIGIYTIWYTGLPPAQETALVAEHDENLPADQPVGEHSEDLNAQAQTDQPTPTPAEDAAVDEHAETAPQPETAPTDTPPPPPTPAPVVHVPVEVGSLRFADEIARNDKVILALSGISPPGEGSVYQAWLQSANAGPLNLGVVTVSGDAVDFTFVDPQGRNLLGLYDRVVVSLEPAGNTATTPSGAILFAGESAPAVMTHLRQVLAASPATPGGLALAEGAVGQAAVVVGHAALQQQSISEDNVPNLRLQAERLINILQGANGPDFGDNDGNGAVDNPGDGFGLAGEGGYIAQVVEQARLAAQAEGATDNVVLHAGHVEIAGANALELLPLMLDAQIKLRIEDTTCCGVPGLVNDTAVWAERLLNGQDANGDGRVDPIPGEGTLQTLYDHAQLMATIPIFTTGQEPAAPVAAEAPAEPQAAWQPLAAANAGPAPRFEHAMQYNIAANQVFVFGGRDGSQDFNDTWALDLNTLTWRELAANSPTRPSARHSSVMIVDDAAQNLYIATGQGPNGNNGDIWKLDLTTEIWQDLSAAAGPGPEPRYGGPGGSLNNNLVLTHGFGSTRYNTTWQFNTQTEQWEEITPAGDLPLNRCLFAATTGAANGSLIIHGGCASGFGDCYLDDTWVLDSAGNGWQQIVNDIKPAGRQHQTLTAAGDSSAAILFGGQGADQAARSDLWALDLSIGAWFPLDAAGGPQARYNHAAVWVSGSGLLVFGGRDETRTPLSDLWLLTLDPTTLEPSAAPGQPPTEPQPAPAPTPELISTPEDPEHDE